MQICCLQCAPRRRSASAHLLRSLALTFWVECILQLKKQKAEEAAAQVAAEIEAREAEAAAAAAVIAAEEARQKQQVEV